LALQIFFWDSSSRWCVEAKKEKERKSQAFATTKWPSPESNGMSAVGRIHQANEEQMRTTRCQALYPITLTLGMQVNSWNKNQKVTKHEIPWASPESNGVSAVG
jgi:hypothetical protein